ncbi:nuclear condensing complex subunit [Mycena rosella]|uniref:Nuclear condensing complex subunit n=1 Tax=Mycena rosella TaxID=1033263 RepID=A0AAD7GQW5_MYCRO|nr:nuclear condensing complex subunit [Mycena rosella]
MAPRPESAPELLLASVAAIFDQAQTSLANHRKNCVALYKIHVRTSASMEKKSKKRAAAADQSAFIAAFLDMISRAVIVKKGPPTVDRIIKFVAQYVRFVNEKAQEDKAKRQPDVPTNSISSGSTDDEDTLASVFVSSILEWVIQGFLAKNKVVRYQTVHLVAEMIMFLGEIDEDSYLALRESLIERSTCDKEPTIRAQAVAALARLIGSEDPSELQHGERSILDVLLEVLASDPAADVRRAALLHLPLSATTLPALLDRARDTDALTRKLVYVSPGLQQNPRHLSIAQREQLVRAGLGDREPAVRLATGRMLLAWLDLVHEADRDEMDALLAFLALFDVVGPGEAVAVDALRSITAARPALFDALVFPDTYWAELTPESTVLARAFVEDATDAHEERLERAALPVVTAFAFHIQEAYNRLLTVLDAAEVAAELDGDGDDDEAEEELAKCEVILGELLRMAVRLDYMDEIGRRKVYTVTRDVLAHPQLPPGLIERGLDVLKEIMPNERELIRVVVEIVMDLREPEEEDEPDHDTTQSTIRSLRRAKGREEMSPAEAARADLTDMRCLALCVSMLERVHGNFEDNSTLEGILADLIIPAVRRKELGIREPGLVGLGLCCLIAKSIAVKSLQLFLSQVQSAPAQLKTKLLQIVFDLMVVYDQELWGRAEDGNAILTFLADTLEAEEDAAVQAVLCVGLAKLLLAGLAADPKIVKSLLLAYISPHTAGNAPVRQCLAYFFPVYCYSAAANQARVREVFVETFETVARVHDDLGEGQTMVTPQQFGMLVVDWTDARKAAHAGADTHTDVHAELAVDILLALYDSDRESKDQEALCTLLAHLHIEAPLPAPLLVKLSILLQHVQAQCPFDDATLDRAVARFKARVTDALADGVAALDWGVYETPEVLELCEFIGIDVPDGRGEAVPDKSRKGKGKPSRSKSSPVPVEDSEPGSDGKEDGDEDQALPQAKPVAPLSDESAPDSEDEQEDEAPPSPVPTRKAKAPGRNVRSKPAPPSSESGHKEEEDKDEEEAPPPPPSPSPPPKSKPPVKNSRARAKPAPPPSDEESGHGSEDEADENEDQASPSPPPSPTPPPRASKGKPPGKKTRSERASAPSEDIEADPDDAWPPSPTRGRKAKAPAKNARSKPPPPPSVGESEQDQVPPPQKPARRARPQSEEIDERSDAENEAPPAGPVTPEKKGRKRVRTPGTKLALPSPAEKKRSRVKGPPRQTERSAAAAVPVRATRSSSRRKAPPDEVVDSGDELGGYSES